MSDKKKSIGAFLYITTYAMVVCYILFTHVIAFSHPYSFFVRHMAVITSLSGPFLLIMIWSDKAPAARAAFAVVFLIIMLHLFSILAQYFANIQISQNISLVFLWDNWPAIEPFLPTWQVITIPIGIGLAAWLAAISLKRVTATMGQTLSTTCLLGIIVASIALSLMAGKTQKFFRDPVLGMLGYGERFQSTDRIVHLTEAEAAARAAYVPSANRPKRNIVIFMADSVNPDHLALFGHTRPTSQFLERMRDEYRFFDSAIARSTCTDSVCGVLSTLASRSFVNTPPFGALGIGQVLREHGYKTHHVLVSDHRRFKHNYYWRFLEEEADTIYDYKSSDTPLNSDRIAIEGVEALPSAAEGPALIFVFFFSPHMSGEEESRFKRFGPFLDNKAILQRRRVNTDEERTALQIHYDNKLVQLDNYMNSAWGALARKGFTQDSIFMFLSDHGEEMGDNDIVGHALSDTITEGLVRIPLVIASNEAAVPDLSRAVPQQLDVMPTLLDMLDLPAPRIWDGISLFTKPSDAAIFHEFGFKTTFMGLECNAVLDRVQEERLEKYIRCRSPNKPTRHQLFDIAADPNQKTNLWGKRDQATREIWEEKLDAHFQFRPGNSRGKSRLRN
ncbi:MAG: sulfatase-like hydrolase/transferase [Novosphingobium sp.]|nr:sulfatase-like hydrolase/transferase [Novosphingobium sp.]